MRALLARLDAVLVQAVIAGSLSFAHLHEIAAAAGQDSWKSWAYPVSVDLLMVAAWRRLRSGGPKASGWCWFLIALAASLGANVATAGLLDLEHVPAWLRILVAGWPGVAFLGGTLLAHTPRPATEAEPDEEDDGQEHEPETAVPDLAPALEPASPSAVAVPAALVEHARKVADGHRARTGAAIDTPTLRARLGVPAPLADAIATQLTRQEDTHHARTRTLHA